MEVHTSCSKPLFIGMIIDDSETTNNGYSLEVIDGLKGDTTSIPISEPLSCEDKKSKSTGIISIRNAITNDNGGTGTPEDFVISVMNIETNISYQLIQNVNHPSISEKDIPTGTYKINETGPEGYTTVLIAGDTDCPSMTNEVFAIKKGKTISCTIYNDDDFNDDSVLQAVVDAQEAADAAQEAADAAQEAADAAQEAADAITPSDPVLDQAADAAQEAADAAQEAADAAQEAADLTDAIELQIIADDAQDVADLNTGSNEVAAPTVQITVKVNNLDGVTADQFEYTIGTETIKKDGDIITIPINTPTMFKQTNFIDNSDPNIPAVLPTSIEGDGNCPDVIGINGDEIGFLTLSANQNIECVIVYGKMIEPGVVFHFDSLRFDQDTIFSPPSMPLGPDDLDKCDATESVLPCIVFNTSTDRLNVVPNITTEQFRVTSLVQFNVVAIDAENTRVDLNGEANCEFESISISPQGKPAFVFDCQSLESEENQFRVNYALIETLQLGKSLT
jgi:multidrug efflux pump subunit AcrA (membrane-fusion protein)